MASGKLRTRAMSPLHQEASPKGRLRISSLFMPANSSAVRLASIIVPSGVIMPVNWKVLSKTARSFSPALPECFFGTFLIRNIPDTSHAGPDLLVLDKAYIEGDKTRVVRRVSAVCTHSFPVRPHHDTTAVAPFEDHITVFRRDEDCEIVHDKMATTSPRIRAKAELTYRIRPWMMNTPLWLCSTRIPGISLPRGAALPSPPCAG